MMCTIFACVNATGATGRVRTDSITANGPTKGASSRNRPSVTEAATLDTGAGDRESGCPAHVRGGRESCERIIPTRSLC